jgi:hypothetical protein
MRGTAARTATVGLPITALLLAGCASHGETPVSRAPTRPAVSATTPSTNAVAVAAPSPVQQTPSAAAQMICQSEVRGEVATALGLHIPPPAVSAWANETFSCTYHLPGGRLILSVHQSTDDPSATRYYQAQQQHLGVARQLPGLGRGAFTTPAGSVLVVKDNLTLNVGTTAVPATLAATPADRSDRAGQIAAAVMSCWMGG